ncbi:MAG: ThuA domain-containing protein [Opitutaceae bacterium]|nr:ThuA domain-containing protein [Opitutaceae bacterium]
MIKEPMVRRDFLKGTMAAGAAVCLLPSIRGTAATGQSGVRGDWFRRNPRVYLLDFQMPDPTDQGVPGMPTRLLQNLDTKSVCEQLAAAGVTAMVVHAKCNQGNAYYNSKVCHKHSSLGDRDLMAEFSGHGRKLGLEIIYYVQLSRERRSFLHAERQARLENGEPFIREETDPLLPSREERPVVCMNGPHRDYIKAIVGELAGGYDFDGLWLDCFSWWGNLPVCYCDACRGTYRKETGRDLPSRAGLANKRAGRDYLRWRWSLNNRIIDDVIGHVRTINPRLTVTHNGAADFPSMDWAFVDADDYVCREYHFNEGLENLSLKCRRNWASKPNVPFEIEVWRFANRLGGERASSRGYQVRPVPALLAEMAAVKAHGGFPQYYDQVRWDGTLERRSLERLKPCFESIRQREAWTGRGQPIEYAGILWSKASQQLMPSDKSKLAPLGMEGVHNAMIEAHLPVCVITERDAIAEKWRGIRTLIIAEAECLADETIRSLEKFVHQGGGLVVTGSTSLSDGNGDPRKDFGLADLLGVNFAGYTRTYYTFVQPEVEHPVTKGLELGFPVSVYKTLQVKARTRNPGDVLGVIVDPMPGFHMGYPPLNRTDSPALVARTVGKGRVVYAAAPLGGIYLEYNHPDTRTLITNAVTWTAGGPPPVTGKAPGTVEIVPWRDKATGETIVHVLNRTAAGPAQGLVGPLIHETIPVHDVEVRVRSDLAGKEVRLQPSNRIARATRNKNDVVVKIDRLDEWEVLVFS